MRALPRGENKSQPGGETENRRQDGRATEKHVKSEGREERTTHRHTEKKEKRSQKFLLPERNYSHAHRKQMPRRSTSGERETRRDEVM